MDNYYGITSGIWMIRQDMTTHSVEILKYGEVVETWLENRTLTWNEMLEILAKKSCERVDK